jgi:serine/threonine-protein kinase
MSALEPEDVIDGKYRIVRLLGKGGMGAVYEGENVRIRRRVAIKVLHAGIAEDQTFVQRFEREAQAAGRIGSPHIVEVLDLGDLPSGDRFMVMEYLEGESLRARLTRVGRMRPEEIFPIVAELLDGLAEAHAAGIVHRDLKPDNVYLNHDRKYGVDFVKILDFGVSKFRHLGGEGTQVTSTGVMLGTPHYMAPEQVRGDRSTDLRADLYSVGVILYRALSGRPPFEADTVNELMFKVALEDAPSLAHAAPGSDAEVVAIVDRATSRKPADRHQSAEELAGLLRDWLGRHGCDVSNMGARMAFLRAGPRAGAVSNPGRTDRNSLAETLRGPGDELSTRMTSIADERRSHAAARPKRVGLVAAAAGALVVGGLVVALGVSRNAGVANGGAAASAGSAVTAAPAAAPLPPADAASRAVASSEIESADGAATKPSPTTSAPTAVAPGPRGKRATDKPTADLEPSAPTPAPPAAKPSQPQPTVASTASGRRVIRKDID